MKKRFYFPAKIAAELIKLPLDKRVLAATHLIKYGLAAEKSDSRYTWLEKIIDNENSIADVVKKSDVKNGVEGG